MVVDHRIEQHAGMDGPCVPTTDHHHPRIESAVGGDSELQLLMLAIVADNGTIVSELP